MRLLGTKLAANSSHRGFGDQLYDLSGGRPSLDLNFANTKSLVDATTGQNLVTFTRASSGTYVDSQGVIRRATTNLLLRSEEFNDAYWSKLNSVTISANAVESPNGQLTADKLVESANNALQRITQAVTVSSGSSLSFSLYIKAAERTACTFGAFTTSNGNVSASIDLSAKTISVTASSAYSNATGSLVELGSGWFRALIQVATSGITSATVFFNTGSAAYQGDGTSGIYLWGAQLEQSSTVGEYIPTTSTINSAPRFDHNPTTGESLGLLVEEQRTNSIRNNTMVGAVAGTPGTLPTYWSGAATVDGLTREIIGTGTQNGINYIDVKFSGTSGTGGSNVLVTFDSITQAAASTGQTWTPSIYLSIVNGSVTNISTLTIRHRYYNAVGAALTALDTSISTNLSSVLQRFNGTAFTATDALTAYTMFVLNADFVNSSPVDITLRIGLPQLEQGAFATSVIPTTTATATRSADVASITGSNWSSWGSSTTGTYYLEAAVTRSSAPAAKVFLGASTSPAESYYLYQVQNQGDLRTFDSTSVLDTVNTISDGVAFKGVVAYSSATLTRSLTLNGDLVAEGAFDGTYGSDLSIGSRIAGGGPTTGTIRRLTYFPTRLANEVLQRITQ